MVTLVKHDLQFILNQIKIAEAHAAGGNLAALVAGYGGNDGLAQAHLLPYGLRTVDGSYNNLLPGRELWGASDQSFPGLFTPSYLNDADGDQMTFGPGMTYTNNDYGNSGPLPGTMPGPGSGTVIDADPRLISNLVADQSLNNPAVIMAALQYAGVPGPELMAALADIRALHAAVEAAEGGDPTVLTAAEAELALALEGYGIQMEGDSVFLPNVSPDEGLSSPYNGWMTIFGQFFDHGLDLVAKGGSGSVYVPLQPDDPLYVEGSHTNFMVLTRVSVDAGPDGRLGTEDDGRAPTNLTTPWVDQNQTYGSTASKQIFMREYIDGPDGSPIASGHLLEGSVGGGLATWADIKAQAREMLGINLTDAHVGKIPLIASDPYGNFIPGANGRPQLVVGLGPDGQLGTADDVLLEGDPAANGGLGVNIPPSAILTSHAFLDDIAHAAGPVSVGGVLQADSDTAVGYSGGYDARGNQTSYDNELLDAHYIAGDGRANENIALTAVHHVFHSEHNRIVDQTKALALSSGDLAFLNEWLLVDVTEIPTSPAAIAALVWDGERLFQVGRFTNEMEYQHLVFEEFGRKMQPDIDVFVFEPSADINPAIAAEFAHVVYRFGHSMLTEDIARIRIDENGNPVRDDISLIQGFLNPIEFASAGDADVAAGAIIRGMASQTGNEIDEFVTGALRNNLLGLPLDLATINLARGRDVGTPPLNEARARFYEETGDTQLKPYESWADFAVNLKNPASVINFIAAYGTHSSITGAVTVDEKRDAAMLLVLGGEGAPADRLDFLNATGTYAGGSLGGLNTVDFWIGGLAEKKMAFGGMLGSSFSFVFEMTMENLQEADRFYYLSRVQGLNLLNELENNTFSELVRRNTDLDSHDSTALPGDLFSAFQMPILEMDISKQLGVDPTHDDPMLAAVSRLVERRDAAGALINDTTTDAAYIRINSNEHFIVGGTENADTIVAGGGDDALWGYGGDDKIEAGYGVDKVFGGAGDDIITNSGTDIGETDFLHGNEGNDVIHGGSGLALIFGNAGNDFIVTGPDGKEAFGGTGNDFMLGGDGGDGLLGNEGDDWLEGGPRFDIMSGDNSELFFNSRIIGHDVMNGGGSDTDYDGESGDDIMFQAEGIQRNNGMAGFDWAIHKGDAHAANSNLGIAVFETQEAVILRDRFDLVEGLSGWIHNDVLVGRSRPVNTAVEASGTAAIPSADSPLDSYSNDLLEKNVHLIDGLAALVAHLTRVPVVNEDGSPVLDANGNQEVVVMNTAAAADILLGGGGSDVITGLAGNDIIDGDSWLNVRISVRANNDGSGPELFSVDSMTQLAARMLSGELHAGQLVIVREIIDGDLANTGVDVAVYTDVVENYTFTRNADGSVTISHTGFDEDAQGDDGDPGNVEGLNTRPLSDGEDRLFNIERLRFSDGNGGTVEYDVDQLVNAPATGLPVINDQTPTEGQTLTVNTAGIQDGNGLGAFSYQWQVSTNGGTTWTDIGGATAASFTPNDGILGFGGQVGGTLRVEVSFTDARGNAEVVYSVPTGVVGDNWDAIAFLANTFNGTAGDDIADGTSGLFGLGANDTLNGNAGDDQLNGAGGTDTLNGGAGNDRIDGGAGGSDVAVWAGSVGGFAFGLNGTGQLTVTDLAGGEGTDTLTTVEQLRFAGATYGLVNGTNAAGTSNGGTGADIVLGHGGNDTVNGAGGNDVLVGGAGNDTSLGGAGNDLILVGVGDGRDFIDGGLNTDTVRIQGDASAETYRIYSRTAALAAGITGLNANTEIVITRNGTSNASVIAELDNIEEIVISGFGGGDVFIPIGSFVGTSLATSTITLDGSEGDDTVDISALTSAHRIVFRQNGGSDTIVGTLRPDDVIEAFGPAAAVLAASVGASDQMFVAGDDDDAVVGSAAAMDTVSFEAASGALTVNLGAGTAIEKADTDDIVALSSIDNVVGSAFNDTLIGAAGANILFGGAGSDVLLGLGGDDVLSGGAGLANQMQGGQGNDTYIVEANDTLIEVAGEGTDTVATNRAAYELKANFENLVFIGTGDFSGVGNSAANILEGGEGNDTLAGRGGADQLKGGAGVDTATYAAAAAGVSVNLSGGVASNDGDGGSDSLTDIENLIGSALNDTLIGSAVANVLTGGAGADYLIGLAGDDVLVGGSGTANTLQGGLGDDRYIVSATGDSIVEAAGEGTDTVATALASHTLKANVENLEYTGAGAFAGVGNALANVITGGAGADTLTGGQGNDTLNGGGGTDIAVFSGARANYTVEDLGGGAYRITDTVSGRDGIDLLTGVEQVRFGSAAAVAISTLVAAGAPLMSAKSADTALVLPAADQDAFLLGEVVDPQVLPGVADLSAKGLFDAQVLPEAFEVFAPRSVFAGTVAMHTWEDWTDGRPAEKGFHLDDWLY
ncbi:peroxidase family protein [Brevundimonas sp. Root1279]|uniref:peroxidase family protein n=1 Tax=Brevundimonas sp. Root1279 TaxID=1736443 RepID=UPI0006F33D5F|nr:peroxidase family protein [Brevundimonas sp. Root1279]KQW80824.1 hypothetical protein ASC65_12695 [Brevundimonas sp. Root1279]